LKAEIHLRLTAGPTSLGALHCKFKMAAHYARLGDFGKARWKCSLQSVWICLLIHLCRAYLDEVLYHYDLMPHARRYICRAAWVFSKCVPLGGKESSQMLDKAVQAFNEFSPNDQRTAYSLTEADVVGLVFYDYL
jgi:hypothetical protein